MKTFLNWIQYLPNLLPTDLIFVLVFSTDRVALNNFNINNYMESGDRLLLHDETGQICFNKRPVAKECKNESIMSLWNFGMRPQDYKAQQPKRQLRKLTSPWKPTSYATKTVPSSYIKIKLYSCSINHTTQEWKQFPASFSIILVQLDQNPSPVLSTPCHVSQLLIKTTASFTGDPFLIG